MARLIVHPRTPNAWEIQLKPGENYIGRGFANDFKIEDPSISGSHCRITVQDGRILLKDLGSTNGTFLNRAPVQEAALNPGQTLHLGRVEMFLEPDGQATAPLSVAAPAPTPPIPRPIVDLKVTVLSMPEKPASPSAPIPEPEEPATVPVRAGIAHPAAATAIHVGEQSCKFHPKAAAHWMCQPCHKFYCDFCVTIKKVGQTTNHLCRTCGGPCVPVIAVAKGSKSKGKEIKQYSDGVVLMRSFGFAFAAFIISTLFWSFMTWVTNGVDVSFIYAGIGGALCGYAVKLGAQDRPGVIFSCIATFFCLVTIAAAKYAVYVMDFPLFGSFTKLATDIAGVVLGVALAWWIGGGD